MDEPKKDSWAFSPRTIIIQLEKQDKVIFPKQFLEKKLKSIINFNETQLKCLL